MRTILVLIRKELLQVFRNKAMLPLLTVVPVVQLIVLSFAASNEVKDLKVAIYDQDHSTYSRRLTQKFAASTYFLLSGAPQNLQDAELLLQKDEADIVLLIPAGMERDLYRLQRADMQLLVNAVNGSKGGIANGYANRVIQDFNREVRAEIAPQILAMTAGQGRIEVNFQHWYNPLLDYRTFMVPGILGTLVTILILVLTAMNVVREREIGTIEQLNVTPIRKYQLILGKLLPFLLIGLFDLAIGLIAGKLIFNIPIIGSIWLIFGFCVLNLLAVLAIGMLISTMADTQQQAMFIAWFFMMIFILMGGLFTPIDSMPQWAQYLTYPNPIAHFVEVMRQVMLKGSTFADVQEHFVAMAIVSLFFGTLAVWTYRKTGA
ncbi:ABC transporter permease [Flavilitoribacter nigricans]|uniref:ABC transporter permease n=1 Tax=Flavilitoribacter nigricans (strain ATCC 23147 / DSM 23189 / NBRC 102662 / NCIMB 1420 / SS-2) TaxID=1122177 RepID=A0A2D0N3X5_FLAN2|nr:ABC transporter permease [Flavilitoribacter nigricans]PHN03205.1 ABC transporter permease [Flavilitoribacter nigricans DSM 23189 = NBRC 102662]